MTTEKTPHDWTPEEHAAAAGEKPARKSTLVLEAQRTLLTMTTKISTAMRPLDVSIVCLALREIRDLLDNVGSHSDREYEQMHTRATNRRRALREANRKLESFRLFIQARVPGSVHWSPLAMAETHHRNNELRRELAAVTAERDAAQAYIERLKAAARGESDAETQKAAE